MRARFRYQSSARFQLFGRKEVAALVGTGPPCKPPGENYVKQRHNDGRRRGHTSVVMLGRWFHLSTHPATRHGPPLERDSRSTGGLTAVWRPDDLG
jgi:hypothetical protein